MAIYNQLSLYAGGGILADSRKSGIVYDSVICIGLGGTGIDALKKLKKEVYRRIKPDHEGLGAADSPVEAYGNIRFLAVDSDSVEVGEGGRGELLDPDREYFHLGFQDGEIAKAFQSKDRETIRRALERQSSWLNPLMADKILEKFFYGDPNHYPLAGNRQFGRLLLMDNGESLRIRLTDLVKQALQNSTGDLNICLFSGLSGGTGGAVFLDVCYILRHILETLGREGAAINGYFFLPDVNLSRSCVLCSPLLSEHVRVNGYAALKELDYLMGLEETNDRFVQDYGAFRIDTSLPPADQCFLIFCTNSDGVSMANGYDYSISVAAEHAMSAFTETVLSPEEIHAEKMMPLLGPPPFRPIQKIHGASHNYSVIGVGQVSVPFSEIHTYLGCRIFQSLEDLRDRTPREKDLIDFVTDSHMTFKDLLGQLTEGITYQVPFPQELRKSNNVVPGDQRVIECADVWTSKSLETLDRNQKRMAAPLKSYDLSAEASDLISRIFLSLYQYSSDSRTGPSFAMELLEGKNSKNLIHIIDRYIQNTYQRLAAASALSSRIFLNLYQYSTDSKTGPFFAMNLLGGASNKNLIHIIDGHIANNRERLSAELRQEPLRKQELETAERNLTNANFINRSKCIGDYLRAVDRWYVHLAVIDRHQTMASLLREVREQLVRLHSELFLVMTKVLDNLIHTFMENRRFLEERESSKDSGHAPLRQMVTISDIKDFLDSAAARLDPDREAEELVKKMFLQWPQWAGEDEDKITRMVSDHISQTFPAVMGLSIEDAVRVSTKGIAPAQIRCRIKEFMKNTLLKDSVPMFWRNGLYDPKNIRVNRTLFVPFSDCESTMAAEELKQAGAVDNVKRSRDTSRISLFCVYTGLPLYAFQGLPELEKAYEKHIHDIGLHLYEGRGRG